MDACVILFGRYINKNIPSDLVYIVIVCFRLGGAKNNVVFHRHACLPSLLC